MGVSGQQKLILLGVAHFVGFNKSTTKQQTVESMTTAHDTIKKWAVVQ